MLFVVLALLEALVAVGRDGGVEGHTVLYIDSTAVYTMVSSLPRYSIIEPGECELHTTRIVAESRVSACTHTPPYCVYAPDTCGK